MQKITFSTLFLLLYLLPASGQEARRIVSLAASITKNIYLLGAGDRLAGCTRYCVTDPADSVVVVADAVNVNMERVVLLRPDIVLVSGLTHPRIVSGLERAGVKTRRLDLPRDFDEICRQLDTLGAITGNARRAAEINRACRERLAVVEERLAGLPGARPRVFFQLGADPLFTALPGTFMDDYIARAGGENIAARLDNGIVSREFVLVAAPDAILVTAMGMTGDEQVRQWRKIAALPAVRSGRVFVVDDSVCSPTPVTFAGVVEEISRLIHPVP
ncbi:MAG: ABC transporter substrate-binding protein [Odoribacteraceae bacterium]|jgi:iron complex transport system substrate-binding protein|nr:ABC transporter substrate-binding protein [Odoribacteraceae bacterium]